MGETSHDPVSTNRLAKVIARHGLCSRRTAETWIIAGRIKVNDKTILTPAFNVSDADIIEVDGQAIAERRGTRLWLYHKPAGLVVTENDPEGRPTVFDELKKRSLPRVLSVGRLDINTEGLLLLTNDGGLKRVLELPATGWLRRYRVRAHGSVDQGQLDKLKPGMVVNGVRYGPIEARLERVQGSNVWLLVALSEGKNREIKNVLESIGLKVNRLIRVSFGPFQLGDIPVGAIETVKARVLQDQLGQKLAKKAGVDFAAPMPDALVPAPNVSRSGSPARKSKLRQGKDLGAEIPGKSDGFSKGGKPRPPTRGFSRGARHERKDEAPEKELNLRRVHFSDGRPPELFEPQAKPKRNDAKNNDFRRDDVHKGRGAKSSFKGSSPRSHGGAAGRGSRRPPSGRSR